MVDSEVGRPLARARGATEGAAAALGSQHAVVIVGGNAIQLGPGPDSLDAQELVPVLCVMLALVLHDFVAIPGSPALLGLVSGLLLLCGLVFVFSGHIYQQISVR